MDHREAALEALRDNALMPIDGRIPAELTIDESIGVAFTHAILAVVERLDTFIGLVFDDGRPIGVRDVDRP